MRIIFALKLTYYFSYVFLGFMLLHRQLSDRILVINDGWLYAHLAMESLALYLFS